MGRDDQSQGSSAEGAEALIRRVRRAKESTKREPSRSAKAAVPGKDKDGSLEYVDIPVAYIEGLIDGLHKSLQLTREEVQDQYGIFAELIDHFLEGEVIRIPKESEDD